MMGRRRLEELKVRVLELHQDGHREGSEMEELVAEVERLREKEWTPERLADALDTLVALYLMCPEGADRGMGNTSLLAIVEWSGRELRPKGSDRREIERLNQKLHEFLTALGVRAST